MNAVSIKNVTKKFGDIIALDDLSLDFPTGKITGLMGADGAGKTTLLRLIIGLLLPNAGEISTLGYDPTTNKDDIVQVIGYMPQKFGMYEDLSIQENLELYADLRDKPHDFEKVLDMTNLAPFTKRLAGKLSGGMKQKLGLACTLLGNPKLLILDEPSVGVDPISRRELIKLVKDSLTEDTAVIWATSYLDEAHNFDEAVVLDKGKLLFQGKPATLSPTAKGFEEEVVKLMGGFEDEPSKLAEDYEIVAPQSEYTVEADNLCKRYGDFYAVKNNTFRIKRGEIFGLLGPNGAGKSTSFKMMCGLAKPTSGTARIVGIDIQDNPSVARSYLGYMAQKFSLYGDLTIEENMNFFVGIYGLDYFTGRKRIAELKEIFGFDKYANTPTKDLPLGIKQRLSLACAVIHEPPVLFLDEPTSGVDAVGRREFWQHINALAKKGVTVLVTTHFMDEAEYCDHISLFLAGQTIAIGTPDELKASVGADNMEDTFIRIIEKSSIEV
ncbi:MAG: ATP-binding cassette domain-containing protein [Phascolarctobacterium sp.]|nr:ATP-binding cassette domain-containing protein [Phascolarctobacterium sp.]